MGDDLPHRPPRDLGALLADESIRLDEPVATRDDAIRLAGRVLVEAGAVQPSYVDAMLERERSVSTFIGDGVAVPHATFAADGEVTRDAIVLVRFADALTRPNH